MAVTKKVAPTVTEFQQWYQSYSVDPRTGQLDHRGVAECATKLYSKYEFFKREADARLGDYWKLVKLADGEVLKEQSDLPNVSSGEVAGLVRRLARNVVQNVPNVEVISKFDDDTKEGIFARHILTSRVIGSDGYSNDMQQNLFATTKTAATLGFGVAIPVFLQDASGSWFFKYDSIHYRDVFPDPGAKDIREAHTVFVRRYLTKDDVKYLIEINAVGWDIAALKLMLRTDPPSREQQSVDHQTAKYGQVPQGYEIITAYTDTGDPHLTFEGRSKLLLRIEVNKHPLKKHPVFFLVLEKDEHQPWGKSQVELVKGRQEFQDLMLNGWMKQMYRNINPSIIGYGVVNATPNLGPGKFTQVSNPNARIEAFEVNTTAIMQFGQLALTNKGAMIEQMGTSDIQMAASSNTGMSATPQGVEAQQNLVDVTMNNYQKAVESFFSQYCSYALTIYFAELKSLKKVAVSADARQNLLKAGLEEDAVNKDGTMDIEFEKMNTVYMVRCIPGSLVEMEDEKQLRILNQLFVPLSQSMPALVQAGDQAALQNAVKTMTFIMQKQIELSGSREARDLGLLWTGQDQNGEVTDRDQRLTALEQGLLGVHAAVENELDVSAQAVTQLQQQVSLLVQGQQAILDKLGAPNQASAAGSNENPPAALAPGVTDTGSPATV